MIRVLPLAAAVLALAACGKAEDKSAAAPDAPAPAAAVPAGPPAFAPAYPGATADTMPLGSNSGITTFQTSDTPQKVGEFYAAAGEANGLASRSPGEGAEPGIVYSAHGTAGEITVIATPASEKTDVKVTWTRGS